MQNDWWLHAILGFSNCLVNSKKTYFESTHRNLDFKDIKNSSTQKLYLFFKNWVNFAKIYFFWGFASYFKAQGEKITILDNVFLFKEKKIKTRGALSRVSNSN